MNTPMRMKSNEEGSWIVHKEPDDPLRSFFKLHNPLYLVSAACMLLGCYLVASAVPGDGWETRLTRVLVLLGALNVYEFLLVGLACYLIAVKRQARDGTMLLIIEVLLLADVTNLLHETYALSYSAGAWVNALTLLVTIAKAGAVVWALKLRFSVRELVAGAAGYLAMLLVPGILTMLNRRGGSMALPLHGAWWVVGMVPLAIALILPRVETGRTPLERKLGAFALGAPWGSLLVHLVMASWQYEEGFHFANVAPMILGWSSVLLWRAGRKSVVPIHAVLIVGGLATVLLAAIGSVDLVARVPALGGLVYSPLRANALALAMLYAWAVLMRCGWIYAGASALNLLAFASGHSLPVMWRKWGRLLEDLVPESRVGWGVLALVAAFIFLGAGALSSVLRKPALEEADRQ